MAFAIWGSVTVMVAGAAIVMRWKPLDCGTLMEGRSGGVVLVTIAF